MNVDLKYYLYFSVCQIGRILFSTLATAILARILGPSGLGRWALVMAAATFFHTLFANWLQQDPFLRFGVPEWSTSRTLRSTWGARLPLLTVGALLSLIAFTGLWPWIKDIFQMSQPDGLLAFAFLASLVIGLEMQTVLQITGRMDRLALGPTLIAAFSIPLYYSLWVRQFPGDRVKISLISTVLLTILVWVAISWKELKKTHWGFSGWDAKRAKDIVAYAWPILPTTLLGYLVNWGNQVVIHRSFPTRQVGLYQSAFQVHGLLVTLAVPFTTILLPRLLDRHLEDPTAMHRFVRSIAPTIFCLWLLAAIPTITILPWLYIRVYGVAFADGVRPLTALLIGTPFCALGQIYTGLFTVQGRLSKIFWITLVMVAVNFIGAWVLVPHDQVTLRTIALSFSAAFILTQCLVFLYQYRALHEPAGKVLTLVVSTFVFSAGQLFLHGLGARLIWGFFGMTMLIFAARAASAVDRTLLERLFSGRLAPLGRALDTLLTVA